MSLERRPGGRRQLAGVCMHLLVKVFPHVAFSPSVRDHGVTLDEELSLLQHVNLARRNHYCQLRVIRFLSHDAAVDFVHAIVTSRIDDCCALLVGPPSACYNKSP